MRLLISFCLLFVTALALLREERTAVLVRELPPAGSVVATRRTDYQLLSAVTLGDTCSGATGTAVYPPEVLDWLAAESRKRGAEGVTCILGFYGRASGFQGSGAILHFGAPTWATGGVK
jgi:hypothetical protein